MKIADPRVRYLLKKLKLVVYSVVNGSEILMPIDPDFNMPRQHDKMLIIQVEDRLTTDIKKVDTLDDPRLHNDTYIAADRIFALIEYLEVVGDEPRTVEWSKFKFTAEDGTVLDKEWLDTMMLR